MKNILLLLRRSTDSYFLPWLVGVFMALGMVVNIQAAQLTLESSVDGNLTTVLAGESFKYNLKYSCVGLEKHCYDAKLTSTLPPGIVDMLVIEGKTGAEHAHIESVTVDGNVVTWNFGGVEGFAANVLPAGSTGDLTLTVRLENGKTPNGTLVTNETIIEGSNAETVVSNTTTVTVTAESVVTLTKDLLGSTPKLDVDTTYRITLCNESGEDGKGGLDLQDVTIVDPLLPNAQFISATKDGVYDEATNNVTWPTKDLPVGDCFKYYEVTVQYPSTDFTEGEIINTVEVTGTPVGEVKKTYTKGATGTFGAGMDVGTGKFEGSKLGSNKVIAAGTLDYGFKIKNAGNVDLTNMVITDTVPKQLEVTSLRTGINNQPDGSIEVSIDYKTNINSEWTPLSGNPFATPPAGQSVNVSDLGLGSNEYITDLRWTLPTVPVGFRSDSSKKTDLNGFSVAVLSNDHNGEPVEVGDEIENTAAVEYTYDDKTENRNVTRKTLVVYGTAGPQIVKTIIGESAITPGGEVEYELKLVNWKSTLLDGPSIVDILDVNLEYVDWELLGKPNGTPDPILEPVENYNGTGKTALFWKWSNSLAYGEKLKVKLITKLKSTTAPGPITNTAYVIAENPSTTITTEKCLANVADVDDIDGDSDSEELICASEPTIVTAGTIASMESWKWVKGQIDTSWHRHPKWGKTARSGTLDYRLVVENTGNVAMTNVVVIDVLPFISDIAVTINEERLSEWQPQLIGAVQAGNGIIVKYSTEERPCRTEVWIDEEAPVGGCKDPAWSTILPEPITEVRSLRFDFGDRVVKPGDKLELTWPMYAPINAPVGTIAWNSFGYVATRVDTGTKLLSSEPIKVGVEVNDFEPAVLGDYVWIDKDEDGIQDKDEVGFNGVRVELYKQAANGEFVYDRFVLTAFDENGNPGYYIFSFLTEGNFILKFFPPTGYKISPMDQGDTGEADDSNEQDSDVDPQTHETPIIFLKNLNHDRSWDMGLIEKGTAALGNYVWFDRNKDGEQNESADNGINGVQVTLYKDNGDGIASIAQDEVVATTLTKNNVDGYPGYYLFDDIKSGQYFVRFSDLPINADGFTTQGATGTTDPADSDPNNKGLTEIISLEIGDNDLSWDAGIIKKPSVLALGNRVWLDENRNGTYNAGEEKGIDGVKVNLYWDVNGDGEYTQDKDKQVTSMLTYTDQSVPGFYLFDELVEGNYIVQIDPSNFETGKPLADLVSSEGAPDPNNHVDHDDNGKTMVKEIGVVTAVVNLSNPSDPLDVEARTDLTVDFGFHSEIPSCPKLKLYALHDEGLNDTQFFTVVPVDDPEIKFEVSALGSSYEGHDIEALDIHPTTGIMYATSGDDPDEGHPNGHVYQVDKETGVITSIGDTGYGEVSGISFHPKTGILWAWADSEGLLTIDLVTGKGTLVAESALAIEALAWDDEGEVLYGTANKRLYAWDTGKQAVGRVCGNLTMPGATEALDMYTGNVLLFALHRNSDLNIHAWKVNGLDEDCQLVDEIYVETPNYYDIEGITWEESCSPEDVTTQP